MADYKIYKLHFTSPLHINTTRDDTGLSMKTIQSDTLYAAIMSCLAKTGAKIPDNGDLGFTTSSLFPFYQKDKESKGVLFLPMPLLSRMPELEDKSQMKVIKKVQWVDSRFCGKLIAGINNFINAPDYLTYIHGVYLTKDSSLDNNNDFIKSEVVQRVKIEDRTGKENAVPYFVDRVSFKDYSGLFFIVKGETSLLEKGLNLLSEEGIGTDRNVGFGQFEVENGELQIDLPEKPNHQMSLSVFIPESKEQMLSLFDSEQIAYDFGRRGGWITTYPNNTLRKNAVYAFLPGSVFKRKEQTDCIGSIVNLKPNVPSVTHPIWRNGKTIMLPLII